MWLKTSLREDVTFIPEARIAAAETGLRLICIDRPGVGESTPHQYDQIIEFASDLEVVVDLLGIDEFAMVGLSGGGPYVLASAYALSPRVKAAAVLGGVAPSVGVEAADGGPVKLTAQLQPLLVHLRTPLAFTVSTLVDSIRDGRFMISDDPSQCAAWAQHPTALGAGENPSWPPA